MIVSEAASTLQVNSRKKFFLSLQFPFSLTLLKNFVISYLFWCRLLSLTFLFFCLISTFSIHPLSFYSIHGKGQVIPRFTFFKLKSSVIRPKNTFRSMCSRHHFTNNLAASILLASSGVLSDYASRNWWRGHMDIIAFFGLIKDFLSHKSRNDHCHAQNSK